MNPERPDECFDGIIAQRCPDVHRKYSFVTTVGEYGNVIEDDRVLCNYAYEIAELIKDKKRMEIYQRWLTKRACKV